MRKKKKFIILIVSAILLLCAAIYYFSLPDENLVYDYNGNAYTQNTRSFFIKKITLPGYMEITHVITADDGWFCCAKNKNKKDCYLFVSKDNQITEVLSDNYYNSSINDVFIYNNMYSIICWYQKTSDEDDIVFTWLTVDFSEKKLNYQKPPKRFSSYATISDGENLWGSDGKNIYKFENGKNIAITEGESVIGIDNDKLLFECQSNICQLDLKTYEKSDADYNLNIYEYRTIDFESFSVKDNNFVGCKLSFFEHSEGSSVVSHTVISDLSKGRKFILFGSVGKVYENIRII